MRKNNTTKKILAANTLVLLLGCFSRAVLAGDDVQAFNLQQVADGVYVHQGVHVALTHPQHDDIANIGFIVGEHCIAVIDTGGSISVGRHLLHAIRKTSDRPICYVINTHIHFDHVLGNAAFLKEAQHFVGHKKLADMMEKNRGYFLENFSDNLGPASGKNTIVAPDLGVEDTMELDLGNRVIQLKAHPPAHTYGDLSVMDTKTQTLWAGDLVFRERIPVLDGKLQGWLAVLEELRGQSARVVIPGHGTTSEHPQAFTPGQSYLKTLLVATQAALAEGMFLEDAVDTIGAKEKQQWLLYEQHHRANVSKAFKELEWQ